jgi:beta-phosphoglucomutase
MTLPKAYIFDLDGVITDTAEYHYRGWKRLANEEDLPFTREDNEALRGVSRRRSLEILLKGRTLPEETMLEYMERKNNYYREFLRDITPADLLPGVSDFLHEAQAAGILLGIGSASKNAKDALEGLGIREMFAAIGDGYSVVNTKPAADLFIWVAGRLNLPPTQCVVFEDAEAGIEAALNGGFFAVGIGPADRVGKAHWVRANLDGAAIREFTLPS